mgnify:CR=1 FL=1
MKVYATELIDGEVVLRSWSSKAQFERLESWVDCRWINVTTTDGLKGYEFANEPSMVVYSAEKKASKTIMRDLFLAGQ